MKDDTPSISQKIRAEGGSTISGVTQIIAEKYYSRSEAKELSEYLKYAVAVFKTRMYQHLVPRAAPPDQPYKFLYAFDIEDTDIFFGREAAGEALHQTVLKDRLTVLHAKSGAGKTSLLNAGLSPRLIREGRLPVYARAYEDPVRAVKRAVAPPSLGPWPELLPKLTLHEFLGLACAHLSQAKELVIILDQFEEFFVFWPESDHRQPLIDALADCYDDKSLPVRFIIALRKDYYSDLADFQKRVPTILYNEYRLDTMVREEAEVAVTGPVARLPQPVAYEGALLEGLLDDLSRGEVELPHLQIVCTRLYEALIGGQTTITLVSYESLGSAEGVLGSYLNDVLARLPGRGVEIAKEVLKELVSSEATRRVLSYGTLAARVEADENELDGVLTRLVEARLLCRDEVAGQVVYEMAHEYLIGEIGKWIDQSDLAFKQAEELLAHEVANWRVHRTLIPRDRLKLLHAYREKLVGWDDDAKECVLRSALYADFAVEDWARLVGEHDAIASLLEFSSRAGRRRDYAIESLVAALRYDDRYMREAAAKALERIGEAAINPLITALQDQSDLVRAAAAEILGDLGASCAIDSLISLFHDENQYEHVRREAAEALGKIGDARAIQPLISALQDERIWIQRSSSNALVRIGDLVVEPLIAALRDQDSNVRGVVVEILAQIGDRRAVEPLYAVLSEVGFEVKWKVEEALITLGEHQFLHGWVG